MPSFNNLKDLERFLSKHPETILEENIGQEFEYECPICKTVEKITIISKNKGKCLACGTEFNIELVVK